MEPSDPTLVAERVGRRIAELRRKKGMTQETFAEALDRPVLYVRRVELATTNLTVAALVEIANALDCKVTTLFAKPRTLKVKPGRPRSAKRG